MCLKKLIGLKKAHKLTSNFIGYVTKEGDFKKLEVGAQCMCGIILTLYKPASRITHQLEAEF